MNTENADRIWFNPSKFWGATRALSREELDRFLDRTLDLAEKRDIDTLRTYDFISIGKQESSKH